MLDGVRHAGVLRNALVGEVNLAVSVNRNVLQEGVATDSVVDIGFAFLVEVNHLSVAAAFVVEHAFVVPTVFVVADEQTLRVGRKCGLARAGEAEEDSGVRALLVRVGGAVHGGDAAERVEVVHDGEHALLHFAAVPRVDDYLFLGCEVEHNGGFRVETEFLVVFNLCLRGVEYHEVGFSEIGKFLHRGTDKHVGHEMSLPSYFHDEAHFEAGCCVGAAEGIHHVELLVGEFGGGELLELCPGGFAHGLVVVLVFFGSPPNGVLAHAVHHKELVLGRAAGVNAGHHIDCAELCFLTFVEAFQACFRFFFKKHFVGRVVQHFGCTGNTVLAKI